MIKPLHAVLFFVIASTSACAENITFRVWGSPWIYNVPIAEYGKPFEGQLADGTLIVHVIETATASEAIDPTSGKVIISGNKITLCYKRRLVKHPSGQPIAAVLYSQALEYTIPGLAARKYAYEVSQRCK